MSGAVDAAQEIMFDAWETEDPRKRVALAREALKVSPDCADAYVLLAEETAKTAEAAIELYGQGVAAGARALGDAAFVEDVGAFWGLLETRPYMRARLGLALALWDAGRAEEAIANGAEMLRLNPGDNQGVRYLVLNWLQRAGRDTEAESLLRRYKDDGGTEWAWSAALAAFRRHGGDRAAARKALARAIEANPHVPPYLLGASGGRGGCLTMWPWAGKTKRRHSSKRPGRRGRRRPAPWSGWPRPSIPRRRRSRRPNPAADASSAARRPGKDAVREIAAPARPRRGVARQHLRFAPGDKLVRRKPGPDHGEALFGGLTLRPLSRSQRSVRRVGPRSDSNQHNLAASRF